MNTMSHFFLPFLVPFVLCLGLTQAQPAPTPSPSDRPYLVDKACQSSSDTSFCTNLLKSDRTSPKADMKGLAFIALKNVEKKASATSLFLKIALDKPEADMEPGVEDALEDCNEHYLTAIELIEDSINALVSNAPNDLTKFMNAAIADIDACDASVKGKGSTAAEVATRNQELHKLMNTALSVAQVSQSPN